MFTAIANGQNPVEQSAAQIAYEIQDACNLCAIVGEFHRRLLTFHRAGITGDNLINHPVSIAFIGKLYSLCRMSEDREIRAIHDCRLLRDGETVEYSGIPL